MKKIFAAAPLLLLAYGIVRLIDGADGNHGPGPACIGHLLFLAGFLLYAAVLVGLRGAIVRGRGLATVAVVAGLIGLLTLSILLTVARKLPVWSPVLLVLGFVLITINLDLKPLGAAALLIAVLPLVTSRQPALREAGAACR
ncbi:MAG TPA: hypothetical protein VGD71_32150 [Kribbella sp.]